MDLYYKQEVSVGLIVIVAILGLFAGLMWLTGRSFRTAQIDVPVQFTDIGTLTEGDPVQISGVRVGRVGRTELQSEGHVLVTLQVQRNYRPKLDARVAIKSLDFLGAKFVAYSPGTSSRDLQEGQVLIGESGSDIAETTTRLTDNAVEVLIGAQKILSDEMAADVRSTLQVSRRALQAMAQLAEGPLVEHATESFEALQSVAHRLDSTLANPAINESLSQLDELTENVTEMAEGLSGATMALSVMLQSMSDTSGSIGKLLREKTIHDDLHELLVSLRRLLDDVRERPGRYTNVSVF